MSIVRHDPEHVWSRRLSAGWLRLRAWPGKWKVRCEKCGGAICADNGSLVCTKCGRPA